MDEKKALTRGPVGNEQYGRGFLRQQVTLNSESTVSQRVNVGHNKKIFNKYSEQKGLSFAER